jgi:hypothetical protein
VGALKARREKKLLLLLQVLMNWIEWIVYGNVKRWIEWMVLSTSTTIRAYTLYKYTYTIQRMPRIRRMGWL